MSEICTGIIDKGPHDSNYGENNCPDCRIAELEVEADNLKAIMLGEGGTQKVDLKQRYNGETK